jgi:ribosome maturation factor RimP
MYKQNRKIVELLGPVISAMGYELWGIEHLKQGRHSLLRIYIDKADGITLSDCETVSRQVTGLLDVEDPIQGTYNLEVSSPGLDRLIFTLPQFARFTGRNVKVTLAAKLDGRRKLSGKITGTGDSYIVLLDDDGKEYKVPADSIELARLVPEIQINAGNKRES